jgi:MFS family permease
VNAFGVFQTYYENNPFWSASPSNISWIGSIQAFLLLLVGVITGPVYDAGYFRHLVVTGAILIPLGFMMTSLAREYWQTMLAQAFLIGLGNGCIFVPSVAILPQYFTTRKALANGLAASGSSIGGVIYPIAFRQLIQKVGFPWATRILGFISFATIWFSVIVMRPRYLPKGRRKMVDWSAFREPPYLLFCFAMFFGFIGFYGPVYYIQPYAIEKRITSVNLGFYLLPILNAASVPGRIVPNFLADYAGPLNILMPCSLITGILAICWIGIKNLPGVIVFAILYGFFSGGFVSMPPVAVTSLTTDMRKLGTRMGQCFFFSAFGLLCGTPVSGAILKSSGGWVGVQLFSGLTIFLAGCLLVAARVASKGWRINMKA